MPGLPYYFRPEQILGEILGPRAEPQKLLPWPRSPSGAGARPSLGGRASLADPLVDAPWGPSPLISGAAGDVLEFFSWKRSLGNRPPCLSVMLVMAFFVGISPLVPVELHIADTFQENRK